jgi:hypothetical protein
MLLLAGVVYCLLVEEWHVTRFFFPKIVQADRFCEKRWCCSPSSLGGVGSSSGCLLVIQGRCGCMLHYFEHVLIVIHRLADGEFSELCRERICSGTKYLVSWVGCSVQNS